MPRAKPSLFVDSFHVRWARLLSTPGKLIADVRGSRPYCHTSIQTRTHWRPGGQWGSGPSTTSHGPRLQSSFLTGGSTTRAEDVRTGRLFRPRLLGLLSPAGHRRLLLSAVCPFRPPGTSSRLRAFLLVFFSRQLDCLHFRASPLKQSGKRNVARDNSRTGTSLRAGARHGYKLGPWPWPSQSEAVRERQTHSCNHVD